MQGSGNEVSDAVLRSDLTGLVVSAGCVHVPVPATLRYTAGAPFEVVLVFAGAGASGADTAWTFGRDLLEDGLSAPSGAGAVRVAPTDAEQHVRLELLSTAGSGIVLLPWDDVAAFLDQTWELVPSGQEQVTWDSSLAALLGG